MTGELPSKGVWYQHGIRHTIPDKRKTRNLKQYRNMSDEEFDEYFEKKYNSVEQSANFEKRITSKLEEFEKEYDLSDLKINDRAALRALVQAFLALEDYEQLLYRLRTEDESVNADNIYVFEKVNKVASDLREDISKLQADLKITRKHRKSDEETSFIDFLESLKARARKFYESKMQYIYCPKCNTLLGTIWTLYPNEKKNKIHLVCNREIDDGVFCDGEITIGTNELLKKNGHSNPTIVPIRME